MSPAGSKNAPDAEASEKIDALRAEAVWLVQDRDDMIEAKPAGDSLTSVDFQAERYVDGLPASLQPARNRLPFAYLSTEADDFREYRNDAVLTKLGITGLKGGMSMAAGLTSLRDSGCRDSSSPYSRRSEPQNGELIMRRLSAMIVLPAVMILGFAATFAQTPPAKEDPRPEQEASAVNGPSLAETLSWLKDRLEADGGDSYTQQNATIGPIKFKHSYQTVNFSSCTVSWLSVSTMSPGLPQKPYKDTVNLADIDPIKVKVAPYRSETGTVFRVLLMTKDGKKSIKDETEVGTVMYAEINWIFMESSMADRVATAVAHAATLCAKEPF